MGDGRTLNHCSRRGVRQSVVPCFLICAAIAVLAPIRAHAQVTGSISGTAAYEYESNVFDLPSGFAPPTNSSRRSDTLFSFGTAFDLKYLSGLQQFYALASVTENRYQHFIELDNISYNADVGWNWVLGSLLDGKFDVTRSRAMTPFYNLAGSGVELSLTTSQAETAQIGVKLNSNWKLLGSVTTSDVREPIANSPDLKLTQTSSTASINYLGFTGVTSGFTLGYSSGDYSGAAGPASPTFKQYTAGLTATYQHNRATFDGQIGYSRRESDTGNDNTSGLTGLFDVKYLLTPKTTVTAKVSRTISSYFLNTGSELDTEAAVGVNWQATYKLAVYAGYDFTYRDYPGQGPNTASGDRVDIQQYANIAINYQPERWLLIRPYANIQTRRSTFFGGDFNATVIGISATVTPYKRGK
jgi:hypothetical protein